MRLLFLTVLLALICSSLANAQQNADTTQFPIVSAFGDTTAITIEEFLPSHFSDEEMRVMITRILHYGSVERSMLNDPYFAPNERYYNLFGEQRPPQVADELAAIKSIRENLKYERSNARKAAAAGKIYWWLQWLLIFL
jgi:pyruvate carboxylase